MSVIVTDAGFAPEDWDQNIAPLDDVLAANAEPPGLDLPGDADPAALAPHLAGSP